jgi:hypothetical protein
MKQLYYPALHQAAKWTYTEGDRSLHRVRWKPYPDKINFQRSVSAENEGEDVRVVPR